MLAEERKKKICQIVNEQKAVRVAQLSKELDITEATVRRDLDELQAEHKVRRTHGGAMSVYPAAVEFDIGEWTTVNAAEKKAIAETAYGFVDDNDAIIVDNSTTVREFVRRLVAGDKKNLTIVTTSFDVVADIRGKENIKVIHVGGAVQFHKNSTCGPIAESVLADLRADKVFIGMNGIDAEFGYSTPGFEEAALKRRMLLSAKQSFILADHTKFRKSYLGKVASVSGEVDYLITDNGADPALAAEFEPFVQVVVAEGKEEG